LAGFGRVVYAFDTFEGLPANTPETPYYEELDGKNPPGKFVPCRGPTIELLREYPNIICVKGTFQETLPNLDPSVKFAFVYLDCDWYSSYQFVVRHLPKHLIPGAVALVDDYGLCLGCTKAIDEMQAEGFVRFDRRTRTLRWDCNVRGK